MVARASAVSSIWLRSSALRAVRSAASAVQGFGYVRLKFPVQNRHGSAPVSICCPSIASRAKTRCSPLASASCAGIAACLTHTEQPRSHHLQATTRSPQSPVVCACIAFLGISMPQPRTHGTGLYSQSRAWFSTAVRPSSSGQPCMRYGHCDGHNAHCV